MPSSRINLLPQEERRKASRERGLMVAVLALVVVIALLGVLYVYENQHLSSRRDLLSSLQGQLSNITNQVTQLKPYADLESQRATMTQAASEIVASRVTWSSILEEISLLIPDDVRLTGFTAAVPSSMLAGSALSGAVTTGTGAAGVTFSGSAFTHKDVAEFMTRLGLMPQLMNVQLVSADKGNTTGAGVAFQITAELRPFLTAAPLAAVSAAATGTGTGGQ